MQNLIYVGLELECFELKIGFKAISKRHVLPNMMTMLHIRNSLLSDTNIFSYVQLNNFQLVMIFSH